MSINYFRNKLYQIDICDPGIFWIETAIVIVQAEPFFAKHGLTYCTMLLVPDNNEIVRIRNIPLGYVDSFIPGRRLRRWTVVTNVPLRRTSHLQGIDKDSRIETFALDTEAVIKNESSFRVVLNNPYKHYQYTPRKQYSERELAKKRESSFAKSVKKSSVSELRKLIVEDIGTLQSRGQSLGILSPDRVELIAKNLNSSDLKTRDRLASESRYFQSIILRVQLFQGDRQLTSEPDRNPKFKSGSGMVVTAQFKIIDWGAVVAETKYFQDQHSIAIKLIEDDPRNINNIYSRISKIDKKILKAEIKQHVYNSAHLNKYVPESEEKILIMGANQKRYAVWYANSFI